MSTPTMADEALERLSLEQKVRLLTGGGFWSLHEEPAVGLRRLVLSDGPAGVRGESWDERDTSANVPTPTALAATWDEALIERVGGLLAAEARRKCVDVVLAPTVNLHRTPAAGRAFECFSEDPLLTGRIGTAFVRGLQAGGVGATVKHFVGNDSETERLTLDARIDERTLRELYLAPFEAIVRDAAPWAVMAAYNAVNGHRMTESPLLRDVLVGEWGFDGVVITDWSAARSTIASAHAALDVIMPGPDGPWGDALVAAVRRGEVDEAIIDEKVARILRLAHRAGALAGSSSARPPRHDDATIAAELRRAAAAGFVLARNESQALPLNRDGLRRVAVIGPNAAVPRTLGGGSAVVFPPYTVAPLDGLRAALGAEVEVEYALGVQATPRAPVAARRLLNQPDGAGAGVEIRFLAEDGAVVAGERRPGAAFNWMASFGPGVPAEQVASVELRTTLRAARGGLHAIGASGTGRYRLTIGGTLAFDAELSLAPDADMVKALMLPPQKLHEVRLDAGEEVLVTVEHVVGTMHTGRHAAAFQFNVVEPHDGDDEELARAETLARTADAVVVVVGTTEEIESEGFDRESLALPGRQDELVRRVAAANPRTVAVVNAGAPVLLPWAGEVAAVLLAWFPGQEFGNALADVLLGEVEPGGRLPVTWPESECGLPATQPADGVLTYDEGLSIGYRTGRPARYAFGHGLGYTSWDYRSIDVASDGSVVTVGVANTGSRRGREVVQLYASRPAGAIERPSHWLVGFAVVDADPGEEVQVSLRIALRSFQHWDCRLRRWTVEPGTFTLAAGSSSAYLPLTTKMTVT